MPTPAARDLPAPELDDVPAFAHRTRASPRSVRRKINQGLAIIPRAGSIRLWGWHSCAASCPQRRRRGAGGRARPQFGDLVPDASKPMRINALPGDGRAHVPAVSR
jgi:hypothetical protein